MLRKAITISLIFTLLFLTKGSAQVPSSIVAPTQFGITFFNRTAIAFGKKDTIAIFNSVNNHGELCMPKGSYMYFFGNQWKNDVGSKIIDHNQFSNSADGGTVEFRKRIGIDEQQLLLSGYDENNFTGPGFSNLIINNPMGVALGSSLNVARQLGMVSGHLYLTGFTTVMGNDSATGEITGYRDSSFIVADQPQNSGKILLRNMKKDVDAVFPIGTKADPDYYYPLTITPISNTDHFSAGVFMGTHLFGDTGLLMDKTSIRATWQISKSGKDPNKAVFNLQHSTAQEGMDFTIGNSFSTVSMFENGMWKGVSTPAVPITPGLISSNNTVSPKGAMNLASIDLKAPGSFYLTKLAGNTDNGSIPGVLIPNVFSPNGDGINDKMLIHGLDAYPDNEVVIYNRWSNEIYKVKNYNTGNAFAGNGVADGTYFYILRIIPSAGAAPLVAKGFVTIIR